MSKDALPQLVGLPSIAFLLATIATSALLANDIFLPLLPQFKNTWNIDATNTVFLLVHFLMMMGIAHLLYPTLIYRMGRRRVLILGLVLFSLASFALASIPDYQFVLFWRSLQAVGVSLCLALSRVIMRAVLPPEQATRGFLLMATLMGIMPAVAPLLGFMLYSAVGLEACFLLTALFALICAAAVMYWVPADSPSENSGMPDNRGYLTGFAEILASRRFWRYASVPTFAYAAYFSYVCASPYLLERSGLSTAEIALSYIELSMTYLVGSFIARRLSKAGSVEGAISLGYLFFVVGGLGLWWELEQASFSPIRCVLEMSVLTLGNGFLLPLGTAGTLGVSNCRPMLLPATLGFFQFGIAAGMAFCVSHFLTADIAMVGRIIALVTVMGFTSNLWVRYFERSRALVAAEKAVE